jgi:hypothetical protein
MSFRAGIFGMAASRLWAEKEWRITCKHQLVGYRQSQRRQAGERPNSSVIHFRGGNSWRTAAH